ncbi:MAG: Na+/H+ antiporter NhaA [Rhodospirillales bacterium]|nr:Na+/H+ antiporter NhaA [Rhodospirillales bacterium]
MPLDALKQFLKMEAAGGLVLVAAAILAVIVANSPLSSVYQDFLDARAHIGIDSFQLSKPLLLWINDGLMAVFFFVVGLEIKREFLAGQLARREQAVLPACGALGGMALPALIFVAINLGEPDHLAGWAIPAATDIAFALGVLALLGSRVPLSLKVLLTAIAVLDDLGAIIIIAVFYTDQLSLTALTMAISALAVLVAMNILGVRRMGVYFAIGAVLWVCVLKSGVHATLAGVALAMTIPLEEDANGHSPARHLEHSLHRWAAFGVLPIFAFANAGVSFEGIGWASLFEPVTLGIALGLFLGKQAGVFSCIWLTARAGLARLPEGTTWRQIYGVCLLCGIGFTMSLFIGGLAWEHSNFDAPLRLGVIVGSILSACTGAVVLLLPQRRKATSPGA